ncbi:hypothetical protein [Amycolatopsis regifaucium]|uniref:Uncharacterized protein n=1 Tax=Amycolatopsis regifaucium TaxID=546365 RepID=A0A154M5V7_9PSEU|nr:hypothetical protein [Amycolatopsis regifaucium]KZB80005.1 hypothetical protein AVL48_13275 [Amycolatopsis regifaucium]OKA09626.1 hypothetical protein ATP06_0209275 [Amycolatopsis regifaucium]SFH66813.1 hypothetical protein SAMN04489731_105471 [Amycolatopsis regifaucium]
MRTMGKMLGSTAAVVLIAACTPPPPEAPPVSTDPAPVAETFPEVGEIAEVSWVEEKMGAPEGRVEAPGPSDFRLTALVKLGLEAVPKVLSSYKCTQVGQLPDTPERLKPLIPAKVSWLSCDLPTTTRSRTVYVVPGSAEAVLIAQTM